jgi:GTP cyclohydrolase I-like protein
VLGAVVIAIFGAVAGALIGASTGAYWLGGPLPRSAASWEASSTKTDGAGERILGLSEFARVVELFARDLQVQEGLTMPIAGWLQEQLAPKGVGVVLEAEHMCMSLRGAQKFGAKTITSALHGLVRDDPRTLQEFLALTKRS